MARPARLLLLLGPLIAIASTLAIGGTGASLNLRDAAGAPVPGAVVFLEGADRGPVPVPTSVIVDQRDKQFVPQVTVIQAGTQVRFPNSDPVSHHVYSFARPNTFELPLYKGGNRPAVQFDHAGIVTLGCNIHDAMLGWIVVVDTPHFGITDGDGFVEFPAVAPGSYQVRVWSSRLDPSRPLDAGKLVVRAGPETATLQIGQRLSPEPPGGGSLVSGDY